MQVKKLFKDLDKLQRIHGDCRLDSIYGCGDIKQPKLCLVFMNPTARNVAADKKWCGLKAPWLGVKNVWKMLFELGLLNKDILLEVYSKKPQDWNYQFAKKVYAEIAARKIYITNLAKATQADARALPNKVFKDYLPIFEKEIALIKPQAIITFGNQVSSIILNKNIKVSAYRKKFEILRIGGIAYKVFPIYYPVGQGTRNIKIAKDDITWITKKF